MSKDNFDEFVAMVESMAGDIDECGHGVLWASGHIADLRARIKELEAELEDVSGEMASLKGFVRSEIRKIPPEYVKGKALLQGVGE